MKNNPAFISFFITFVLLNLIDALTTISILSLGGSELNLLPAIIIENYGLMGFLEFKFFGSLILGSMCLYWKKVWNILVVFFAIVCAWNTIVITVSANQLSSFY